MDVSGLQVLITRDEDLTPMSTGLHQCSYDAQSFFLRSKTQGLAPVAFKLPEHPLLAVQLGFGVSKG